MVINCYYPINPYKEQHIWSANAIFDQLFKELVKTYTNIKFNLIDSLAYSEELGIHHHGFPGCKFGYHRFIIENSSTKKYFVVNYYDTLTSIHEINGWDTENLVEIFSSTGAHKDTVYYRENTVEYTPSSYCIRSVKGDEYFNSIDTFNKTNTSLSFRGNLYLFRKFLSSDKRFNIVNTYYENLDETEYYKELLSNTISLSLNGTGEICHRDIESFAASCVVIRPELTVKFKNPLINGKHYIGVKTKDLEDVNTQDFYRILSDRLYSKYIEIKDDKQLIEEISNNARQWYKQNGSIKANVDILLDLINLSKLT